MSRTDDLPSYVSQRDSPLYNNSEKTVFMAHSPQNDTSFESQDAVELWSLFSPTGVLKTGTKKTDVAAHNKTFKCNTTGSVVHGL